MDVVCSVIAYTVLTCCIIMKFDIGYNFGKVYWGNGYATETMREILRYARDVLHVNELVGRFANENPASGNVLKNSVLETLSIPYEANEGRNQYKGTECRLVFSGASPSL